MGGWCGGGGGWRGVVVKGGGGWGRGLVGGGGGRWEGGG